MNVKCAQQIASFNESDANGRVPFMKVSIPSISSKKEFYHYLINPFDFQHTALEHEKVCLHPKKSGAEVMLALQANDVALNEERKLFSTLIELLSYEKIIFNGMKTLYSVYFPINNILQYNWEMSCFHKFSFIWFKFINYRFTIETIPYRWICSQIVLRNFTFHSFQSPVGC